MREEAQQSVSMEEMTKPQEDLLHSVLPHFYLSASVSMMNYELKINAKFLLNNLITTYSSQINPHLHYISFPCKLIRCFLCFYR